MSKIIKISCLLSAAAFLFFAGCKKNKPPETPDKPSGPTIIRKNTITEYTTKTHDPNKDDEIRYIFDWGDGNLDTTRYFPNDSMVDTTHAWVDTGKYLISVRAQDNKNALSKDWSDTLGVTVVLNRAPNQPSTPTGLSSGLPNIQYTFKTVVTDPDNDSVAVKFDWGNGRALTWTNFYASGDTIHDTITYSDTGTFSIRVVTKDIFGDTSEWSDTFRFRVLNEGYVKAVFQATTRPDEGEVDTVGIQSSPAIAVVNGAEKIFIGSEAGKAYMVNASDMRQDFYIYPDIEEAFDEEPWGNSAAVNMSTGHWYIANDQGEIYCLTTAGQKVWRYPNMPVTSFTGWDFTDAAFSGYNVYVVNRTRDSLYVLSDASGMKVGYYAEFGITTAPTIDAQGNVYIGDDSGYVYKLNATGGLIWKHKLNGSIVTSGAINLDGTIYFAADVVLTGYLYALNPDSTLKWSYTVGENVVTTPVIGTDGYIYFGDERGKIHAVNASTGTPKTGWLVNLASTVSTPAFAADGYFYIMTDDQRVFCINCIDGNIRWETPLPTSAKTKSLFGKRENWIPSPVIGSDGDIYVACGRAHRGLYKLQGRSSGIPANTPWPMFRHDRNHSGKAGFIPSR